MKRGTSQAGFTLVELTVALVAGLIVAMGIVGLSRAATQTFNEEVRSSAAESALRAATDRLRADLGRAAYMSTANILYDPMIARAPTDTNVAHIPAGMKGLLGLGAIQLQEGGSVTLNGLPASTWSPNALAPDTIVVGGNLTTAEQFDVQMVQQAAGTCTKVYISALSAAFFRAVPSGTTNQSLVRAALSNLFAPVTGNGTTAQFMVRILDETGHSQYLATCPIAYPGDIDGNGPFIAVDTTSTPIVTAAMTAGVGGISGYGRGWINPVQLVRWEITSTAQEAKNQQQFAGALGNVLQSGNVDPNKYDLTRTYLDAFGNPVWASSEIVAEYAVDLDFAFSVDTTAVGATQPSIISYAFDDANNALYAPDLSTLTPPVPNNLQPSPQGPQRIRSVRARVAARAALADRSQDIPSPQAGFVYRYCLNSNGCPAAGTGTNNGALNYARVHTMTLEVALPNNAGFFY